MPVYLFGKELPTKDTWAMDKPRSMVKRDATAMVHQVFDFSSSIVESASPATNFPLGNQGSVVDHTCWSQLSCCIAAVAFDGAVTRALTTAY